GLYSNKHADVANCCIHHCALDAIIVSWTGLKDTDPVYTHTIKNVTATYNGRQGISWVGGNNLTVVNSEFSSTGKALNNGVPVISKPSAGIDIEIESSIIKNGNFIGCRIYDNAGPGLSSIGHDTYNINFKNCTFIGTTNSAAYPKSQGFSFDSCTFVGMVQRIFGSADKSKAISFKDCLFTMDKKRSPNGKVFGKSWEFYEGQNVIFDHCVFDAKSRRLPIFNTPEIVFLNCTFSQNSDENFDAAAIFKGTTKFVMKGKGKIDASKTIVRGALIYNNQKIKDLNQVRDQ
nr:right-handed parallel beta-helix repeat-containing protein [Bacteroidota bacterium]